MLHPRAPILFVCNLFKHSFCQGNAPKNFAGGGIIPPHPLCEGVTPSRSHTYLFVARSNICFVKELRRKFLLAGVLYPHTPFARVLHPRAPCGGIIPPHPQAIALLPPAPVLSRNSAENFCLRGYYTPTPPLRGCYTLALPVGELFPHTPKLLLCCLLPLFCQGIAPKNFYLQRRQKFFAPLTTTKTTIINTRAERFPAPRLSCYTIRIS